MTVALSFIAGALVGGAVVAWGSWLGFRDNARRYFLIRGYGREAADREADRVMGVDWYDPRDADDQGA